MTIKERYKQNKFTTKGKVRTQGFTLIELIVVMAVIAILVLLAAPKFLSQTDKAKTTQILNDAKVLEAKIDEYLIRNGQLDDNDFPSQQPGDGQLYDSMGEIDTKPSGLKAVDKTFYPETNLGGTFYSDNDGNVIYEDDSSQAIGELPNEIDYKNYLNNVHGTYYFKNEYNSSYVKSIDMDLAPVNGFDVTEVTFKHEEIDNANEDVDKSVRTYKHYFDSENWFYVVEKIVENPYTINEHTGWEEFYNFTNGVVLLVISKDGELLHQTSVITFEAWNYYELFVNVDKPNGIYTLDIKSENIKEEEFTIASVDIQYIDEYAPVAMNDVKQLSMNSGNSLALMNDGTVKMWGMIGGQQGKNYVPLIIPNLSNVKEISSGGWHYLALRNDGTVMAWMPWGVTFSSGQLGNGDTTPRFIPEAVSGLTGAKQITAGGEHSLALMDDGSVKSWGDNYWGQLGDGTTTNKTTPVDVKGLAGVKQVTAGASHSLALMNDGTVMAWGDNRDGELGDYTGASRSIPSVVVGLTGVKQVAAGNQFSLALMEDGRVMAWGTNWEGRIGDGTQTTRYRPVQILTGVKELAAGPSHALALMNDGTVKVWGSNDYGQLGLGDTTLRLSPVTIAGLTDVKKVATGAQHSMVIMNDGTVKNWGDNTTSELGFKDNLSRLTPTVLMIE